MKKIIGVTLLSLFMHPVFTQENKPVSTRAQTVNLEGFGNGLFLSANYDFRFAKKQNGFGMRLGLGFVGLFWRVGVLTIPIGINYLLGKGPNYFETGLGLTYFGFAGGSDFLQLSKGILVPSIGYRYQPLDQGFSGRIFISPLVGNKYDDPGIYMHMYGGFSVGVKF